MTVQVEFTGNAQPDEHKEADHIDVVDGHLFVQIADGFRTVAIYRPGAWEFATVKQ